MLGENVDCLWVDICQVGIFLHWTEVAELRFGLQNSFQCSVLRSLWNVGDKSTAALPLKPDSPGCPLGPGLPEIPSVWPWSPGDIKILFKSSGEGIAQFAANRLKKMFLYWGIAKRSFEGKIMARETPWHNYPLGKMLCFYAAMQGWDATRLLVWNAATCSISPLGNTLLGLVWAEMMGRVLKYHQKRRLSRAEGVLCCWVWKAGGSNHCYSPTFD